ncbi:hypothetical protein DSM112329_00543 [Paraconexibacter sp. AEG42_29]|uniref:Uncharacterized protein n=1 Tax=Paraconexibacter sp. AEG42_29 TaxID=2997339 RepID=A0AAU7APW9_9ACTN
MARSQVTSTIRIGPKVERTHHDDVLSALLALRERLSTLDIARDPVTVFRREIAPGAQVAARGELRGKGGLNAGVDVRGDGSAEAWTGRWRRQLVAQQPGEDAYAALGRVLGGS